MFDLVQHHTTRSNCREFRLKGRHTRCDKIGIHKVLKAKLFANKLSGESCFASPIWASKNEDFRGVCQRLKVSDMN